MFNYAIQKGQRSLKFIARHIAGRLCMERLIEVNKALFYVAQYRDQSIACHGSIRIARSELYQRRYDRQATQATQTIGVIEHKSLYRRRIVLLLRDSRSMAQNGLFYPTSALFWHIQ